MDSGSYNLQLARGRARTWWAQLFQDSAGTEPVDLSGCTPLAGILLADGTKISLTAEVADGELPDGTAVTPEDGWVSISISAEDCALLTGSYYLWALAITDSLGDWNACLEGAVHVRADATPEED